MGDLMRRWMAMIGAQPHRATRTNPGAILIAEPKIDALKVTFAPVQSGSGTPSPSNVRPITGHESVAVSIGADTFTSALGGTYYGGTVDLVSGVMTVTKVGYTFTGNETVSKYGSGSTVRYSVALSSLNIGVTSASSEDSVCSHFTLVSSSGQPYGSAAIGGYFQPSDPNAEHWADVTAFQSWLEGQYSNGTPVRLILPMTQDVTLTPQTINALRGMQTVTSDAGSVEITYYTV